jgi:hypothetical protein
VCNIVTQQGGRMHMAIYPIVDQQCPFKKELAAHMQGDFCTICDKQVVDLSPMTDDERVAFVESRTGDVCVSYKLPLKRAIAAAALSAMVVPMAAAAQDASAEAAQNATENYDEGEIVGVFSVGAIKKQGKRIYIETAEDLALPELPIATEPDTNPPKPDNPTQRN